MIFFGKHYRQEWNTAIRLENFTLIQSQGVAVYLTLSRQFTFAMRTGGGTLWGDPDYYRLTWLGGNTERV